MTFTTDIQKKHRNLALLVEIALTQPSAKTLYFSNRDGPTAGGLFGSTYYENRILDYGTSAQRADMESGEVVPLTGSLTLQNTHISVQAAGEKLGHLLQDYVFAGAAVTAKIWNIDTGTNQATFTGYITNIDDYTGEQITFNLGEQQKFDIEIPPTVIEPGAFPDAPEDNYAKRVSLCYGSFALADNRPDNVASYIACAVPAICVDKTGPTAGMPVIRACDNDGAVAAHTFTADPLLVWESAANEMCLLDSAVHDVVNTTAKAEIEITSNPYGYIWVSPTGIGIGNTAVDPGKAMDNRNSTYATITNAQILSLTMPTISNLGSIIEIRCYVHVNATDASGTLVYGVYDEVGDAYYQSDTYALAGTPTGDSFVITALEGAWRDWRFIEDSGTADIPIELRAELQSDTGYCRVKALSFYIKYYLKKDFRIVDIKYTPGIAAGRAFFRNRGWR